MRLRANSPRLERGKLYVKWTVRDSYELKAYKNIPYQKFKEIESFMDDIIYNHKAVDAQLEYTTKGIVGRR